MPQQQPALGQSRREKRELEKKAEAEYKQFTGELARLDRAEDPKEIQGVVTRHLEVVNQLYPVVKKRLPGSGADAKHVRQLMQLASATAKRINSTARPFDLHRFVIEGKREHGPKFNDHVFEIHALNCFMPAPTFEFFYGAIKREGLQIKQRKKRVKIQTDQDKDVSSVRATERNLQTECEQDSTPKEVESIYKKIVDLTAGGQSCGVKLLSTLIDPNSFTQTVENIFHASFLVKEGKVGIEKGSDNKPMLTCVQPSDLTGGDCTQGRDKNSQQSIFSFSMADYDKWKSEIGQR